MADETTTIIPLIRTRLHRPPVAGDRLHRQYLLDLLNQRRQRPLALISAPAGPTAASYRQLRNKEDEQKSVTNILNRM